MLLHGHRALIIGATGGLGPSIVEAFLALGADVVAVGRLRTKLDSLRAAMKQHDKLRVAECDASSPEGVESLFDSVSQASPIDFVIYAAGAFRQGDFAEVSDADADALFRANVLGPTFVLRAALRRMIPRGAGQVLLVAAEAANRPPKGLALYGATKAAVATLAGAVAAEVEGSGVSVNCLLPGVIDSAPNREAMPHANHAEWVSPEEIAKLCVGLAASDEPPNGMAYQFPLEPPGR